MSPEWPQICFLKLQLSKYQTAYVWCGCGLLSKLSFVFPPFASWEEMNLWKWRKWLWMFRGHPGDQSPRCCVSSESFCVLFSMSRTVTRSCRVLSKPVGYKSCEMSSCHVKQKGFFCCIWTCRSEASGVTTKRVEKNLLRKQIFLPSTRGEEETFMADTCMAILQHPSL